MHAYKWTWLQLCVSIVSLQISSVPVSAGNACSNDPYKSLLFLSTYSPAIQFCAAHYPRIRKRGTTTAKTTRPVSTLVTSTRSSAIVTSSKGVSSKTTSVSSKASPTTKSVTTSATCTGACSVWTSCTKNAGSFLSTLCSCLLPPKTSTTKSTSSARSSSTTTARITSVTTTKPSSTSAVPMTTSRSTISSSSSSSTTRIIPTTTPITSTTASIASSTMTTTAALSSTTIPTMTSATTEPSTSSSLSSSSTTTDVSTSPAISTPTTMSSTMMSSETTSSDTSTLTPTTSSSESVTSSSSTTMTESATTTDTTTLSSSSTTTTSAAPTCTNVSYIRGGDQGCTYTIRCDSALDGYSQRLVGAATLQQCLDVAGFNKAHAFQFDPLIPTCTIFTQYDRAGTVIPFPGMAVGTVDNNCNDPNFCVPAYGATGYGSSTGCTFTTSCERTLTGDPDSTLYFGSANSCLNYASIIRALAYAFDYDTGRCDVYVSQRVYTQVYREHAVYGYNDLQGCTPAAYDPPPVM